MKALDKLLGGQQNLIGIVLLALLILVVFPLTLDAFRLNMVGKYLTYAFVAVGLVLCWGYGGILSLGQGVFFGVGGYCMAMFLKLEASDPESTKIQSTPGIPDFMDWNQITELPWLWQPFHSFSFTVLAVIAVPVLLAFIIGMALFKRRVGDVYFSIVTQAIALILTVTDRRPAGPDWRRQRYYRPQDPVGLGPAYRQREDDPVLQQRGLAVWLHLYRALYPRVQAGSAADGDARQGRARAFFRV